MALGITLLVILSVFSLSRCHAANFKLFREYIGAESDSVKFSDVPINPEVEFHFILAFAIDYTKEGNKATPTNGNFDVFWETKNLGPAEVAQIKQTHPNVKIAISLGGATAGDQEVHFAPESVHSWLQNAVSSLTKIIQDYHIDGIDIDYEHFSTSPEIFAECIGQLVTKLKNSGTISFASIAPFEDEQVQGHYLALWSKYGDTIDYVNFQFYAYNKLSVSQFVNYFNKQVSNYGGGQVLASFMNKGGGIGPNDGFFDACNDLIKHGNLGGIFVWCADESKKNGFRYEKKSQQVLALA